MNKYTKKGAIKSIMDNDKLKPALREEKVFGREIKNLKNIKSGNDTSKFTKNIKEKDNIKPLMKDFNENYYNVMNKLKKNAKHSEPANSSLNQSKISIHHLPDNVNLGNIKKKDKKKGGKKKSSNYNSINEDKEYNVMKKKDLKKLINESSEFNSEKDSSDNVYGSNANDINESIDTTFNYKESNKPSNVALYGSTHQNSHKYDKKLNTINSKVFLMKNKLNFTNSELMKTGVGYSEYKQQLTNMDKLYEKEVLYTVEYVTDIYKELFSTQVSFILLLLFIYYYYLRITP